MGIIKDPTSWRTGFELGLAGFSFPYSKPRKPTAYLYNGVRLPALPEWDKETYPYAIIYHVIFQGYGLCVSAAPWHGTGEDYVQNGETFGETIASDSSSGIKYSDSNTEKVWKFNSEGVPSNLGLFVDNDGDGVADYGLFCACWSNHDIISADGTTVLIAASDPVPVYE